MKLKTADICSLHFMDTDYENLMQHQVMGSKLLLKKYAVPSVNFPKKPANQLSDRIIRMLKRQQQK